MGLKLGYVLLIRLIDKPGKYKIGVTSLKRKEQRLREIQEETGSQVELIHECFSFDPYLAKRLIKQQFSKYQIENDLYYLSDSLVAEVIRSFKQLPVLPASNSESDNVALNLDNFDNFKDSEDLDDEEDNGIDVWVGIWVVGFTLVAVILAIALANPSRDPNDQTVPYTQGQKETFYARGVIWESTNLSRGANLRDMPNGKIIKVLPNGTPVRLGVFSSDRKWRKVRTQNGEDGWVWSQFLQEHR